MKPIPTILLERLLLDELPSDERARLEALLAASPKEAARFEAMRVESEALRLRLRRRSVDSLRPRRRWAFALAALGIAVLATSWLTRKTDDDERMKGAHAGLQVFLKTADGSVRLDDGAVVPAYSVVQLAIDLEKPAYAMVVSIDGRKNVTLHDPPAVTSAPAYRAQRTVLPFGIQLDDAPEFERFVLISKETTFELEPIVSALSTNVAALSKVSSEPLTLPPGFRQTSILVRKQLK